MLDLRIRAFLQPDVQRRHAALNIHVAHDNFLAAILAALVFDHRRRMQLQLAHQRIVEAREREGHVGVLQRIGHAPDAVVLLDQLVLGLDQLARGLLGRRVVVLDHLEHVRVRRQREHQHHQALDAGRADELVRGVLQVMQEVPVEQVLALLLQAQRGIDFSARLARHDVAQEGHVRRRDLHVDHEVRVREGEQDQQLHLL